MPAGRVAGLIVGRRSAAPDVLPCAGQKRRDCFAIARNDGGVPERHGEMPKGVEGKRQLRVASCRLTVVSCQLTVVSCQLSVENGPLLSERAGISGDISHYRRVAFRHDVPAGAEYDGIHHNREGRAGSGGTGRCEFQNPCEQVQRVAQAPSPAAVHSTFDLRTSPCPAFQPRPSACPGFQP